MELRDGRVLLAGDTVEVYLHGDGTVTAWRSPYDWCHIEDWGVVVAVLGAAHEQSTPVRAHGDPPPMNRRGVIRL